MKKFLRQFRPMKNFIFRFYGWIAFLGAIGIIFFLFRINQADPQFIFTVLGSAFSFVYFVQKQKLEETALFKELFQNFNTRYDHMNEELNKIYNLAPKEKLSDAHKQVLYDYFNLCAEEYLYYSIGYIHPDVWNSWKHGIRHYLSDPRIEDLFIAELHTESYYKLSLDSLKN